MPPKSKKQKKDAEGGEGKPEMVAEGWGNLLDKYKMPEGAWTCPACTVVNKDPDAAQCMACEAPNPNMTEERIAEIAAKKEKELARLASLFGSGKKGNTGIAPAAAGAPAVSFGAPPAGAPAVTFGAPPAGTPAVTFGAPPAGAPAVTFGAPPAGGAAPSGGMFKPTGPVVFGTGAGATPASPMAGLKLDKSSDPDSVARGWPSEPFADGGKVVVVGSGECGQLGLGDETFTTERPKRVAIPEPVTLVCAGALHNVVLTTSGKLFSWGCNDDNALGRAGDELLPAQVKGIPGKIVKVSCGDCHTTALTADGHLYAWGTYKDGNGPLGFAPGVKSQAAPMRVGGALLKERVVDVCSGTNHTLALCESGVVYAWGDAEHDQLGRKSSRRLKRELSVHPSEPVSFRLASDRKRKRGGGEVIKQVFSGAYHNFAVAESGKVFGWGLNNFAQLGTGDLASAEQPRRVEALEGKTISQIAGGMHFTVALMQSGSVYAFGRGDSGELGSGKVAKDHPAMRPQLIPGLEGLGVQQIACGSSHAIALTESGDIFTWGFGEVYQLASGQDHDEEQPYHVKGKSKAMQVDAGAQHSIFLGRP